MHKVEHCLGNIHSMEPSVPAFTNREQQQYIFIVILRIYGTGFLLSTLADKHFSLSS